MNLQRVAESLRDALNALPAGSRLIAAGMVAAVALGLGLLLQGGSNESFEHLFGGRSLSESEVDSVELAFSQAGLQAWIREGRRIRIPSHERSDYLAALHKSATLPLPLRSAVQEALDQASPFESSDQRHAREMHAKARDLGAKLSAFADIRWASVEYDRGERTGLARTRPQSASVIVSPEGAEPLSKARVNMIKDFVRGAYAGMTSEDVVVTDTNASATSGYGDDEDPLLRRRREEEASYEQKILRALVGYGPIRVAAHVELDPTLGVEKASLKYGPPGVTWPAEGGRTNDAPDVHANRAASLSLPAEPPNRANEDSQGQRGYYAGMVAQQYELSKLASLQVRRVRLSVGLPTSYYDKILLQDFLRDHPGKTAADMPPPSDAALQQKRTETEEKIKAAVTQLLPLAPPGEDPYPLVHVWDYPDLPEPAAPADEEPAPLWAWLAQPWAAALATGAALLVILLVTKLLLSGPVRRGHGVGESHGSLPAAAGSRAAAGSAGTPERELEQMVASHPEVATQVLRAWIAEAA